MARCRPFFLLVAFAAMPALAQVSSGGGIEVPGAGTRPPGPAARPAPPRPAAQSVPLDRVIAVVNDEALTQYELDEMKRIVLAQMRANNVKPPPSDVFDAQILERLIIDRALLQYAKENGVRIDDQTVERTILRIAQENKITPEELRRALDREKVSYAKYREDIRREVTIQRLREREVDSKVQVSEAEVDNYLATVAAQGGGESEYQVAHIMVGVPEQATPDQIEARRRRAEQALAEVKGGKEFSQIAAQYSDAQDGVSGGDLGWRTPARLPPVFVSALKDMKKGDVSPVLRSPGGFHIVKLNDVRSRNAPTVVEQTHVRHILIRVNEVTSESEAKSKAERIKDRIDTGASFADQAKLNSEDASSTKGGDLGWVNPGDTVPEFEQAMNKLKINEISAPVRSPFGWHLILVEGRRTQDVTLERKRDLARAAIRARKSDEGFSDFQRQVRDKAYVEYKLDDK
ncbi:MAG TPA: peptidylprolyl isomerase [Casimicrobiaceae bacterium]|nr:peptidylprolyl isomerase [Casimicrobiaceae bacterium]